MVLARLFSFSGSKLRGGKRKEDDASLPGWQAQLASVQSNASDVFAGVGVDLDAIPFFNKERGFYL